MSEMTSIPKRTAPANIKLQGLINDIHSPQLLKELINDYEALVNPTSKFQVESIIAILSARMKQIAINFTNTNTYNTACLKQIEALAKLSTKAKDVLSKIDTTINASDTESSISMQASQLLEDIDAVNYSIQKMYLVFMDETFEESSTDLESLFKKYKKLDEMLSNNTGTPEWMMKQIKMDTKELNRYAKEIALTPIKTTTKSTYQNTLPALELANSFYHAIVKAKANSPLISDELVIETQQFMSLVDEISSNFNKWINLLYQYDQQLMIVKEHIESFGIIAKKVNS